MELIHKDKAKIGRGLKHLLDKIPLYSSGDGNWYYDKSDIDNIQH